MRFVKYLYLLPLFLSLSLFSCKKDTSPNVTPDTGVTPTPEPESDFIVDGVSDIVFENWIGAAMGLTIEYISGEQRIATISMGEMPPGVTYEIKPESGTPTFGSSILFKSTGNSIGTHPTTLTVSNGSVTKDYSFNLQLGDSKCTDEFVGYDDDQYINCFDPTLRFRFVRTSQPTETSNRLLLSFKETWNADDVLFSFYIDFDCSTNEIIVPSQQTQLGEVSGNGHFAVGTSNNGSSFVLSLKLISADGTVMECSEVFTIKK